jgi:phosphomannomutase
MATPQIRFGTDGWRGVVAADFTYDNVALVGTAIEHYLRESDQAGAPLLIGYDRRFAAEAYAAHLATHLKALGRDVAVCAGPVPTPVVAFGVMHLRAAGAIQLTASHNPHYYQGLKFIPHFAGPAMPEATDRVTDLIAELAPSFAPPTLTTAWDGERVELRDPYFEHLDTIVNADCLASGGWRVLYNPMHGVGAGYLDAYLERAGLDVVTIAGERDVYFGGGMPDPSPANLTPLSSRLIEDNCDILIGTDGDADRFGIVDPKGSYFGANQALPLLADYLIRYKHLTGELVRTVATSHLLDDVAREHGLDLLETAVGFKYVGERLRRGALIGGEESGGISIQGHIPEKDAILTSILMLELAATTGDSFDELLAEMHGRLGPREYVRIDLKMTGDQKQQLLIALAAHEKPDFAGKPIQSRVTTDGFKFLLEDGSWAMVRVSGTEPVVRVYIETTRPVTLARFRRQVLAEVESLAG